MWCRLTSSQWLPEAKPWAFPSPASPASWDTAYHEPRQEPKRLCAQGSWYFGFLPHPKDVHVRWLGLSRGGRDGCIPFGCSWRSLFLEATADHPPTGESRRPPCEGKQGSRRQGPPCRVFPRKGCGVKESASCGFLVGLPDKIPGAQSNLNVRKIISTFIL